MDETLHELSAAYALDALDPAEHAAFEEHLAECDRCREDVASFAGTVASLAFAVEEVAPPPQLRGRILDAARAERPNVVPLRPRWQRPLAAVAAVAACLAVGLAAWNVSLHRQLSDARTEALGRVAVAGAPGSFVVSSGHSGALVVVGMQRAPAGKTWEAWVMNGKHAYPAGLFRGGAGTTYVALTHPVRGGSVVAVTLEPAGGSAQPTSKPLATATL